MIKFKVVTGTILAVAICCFLNAETPEFQAHVVGISDGDTIKVLHSGTTERIRLWGIDCPEKGQPFGARAKEFTGELAFGKSVRVLVHDIDRYGRQVAEIILPDGRNLNHEILKAGYGWWFFKYARQDGQLERLQSTARAARVGLWTDLNPVPPWDFRRPRTEPELK